MSGTRLSGKSFDVMVGDHLIHVENMSAQITDNRKVVHDKGVPNGHVDGDVECSGELELDAKNLKKLTDVAQSAGSWREMDAFNIVCAGQAGTEEQKIELFGCLLNITDLLNLDSKGGEKSRHKVAFQVTSPDFVRLNGVPYLAESDTENL
jgi:hypothetical protein